MRIYFIRHGQSANNARPTVDTPRTRDPVLTSLGLQQAERLAHHLATNSDPVPTSTEAIEDAHDSFGITSIYCSPMWRALQTAHPLADALSICPIVWDDIHEQGGIYEIHDEKATGYPGKTRQEIQNAFPDYELPDSITDQGWWNREYESWDAAAHRAQNVADRLIEMSAECEDAIALITHQFFIGVVIKLLTASPPFNNVYFNLYNTGITRLDIKPNGVKFFRYMNRIDHLSGELITT